MNARENDALDALLFGADGKGLVDFKCFRGDRDDVSEEDIKEQIHSALMQKKMKRAAVSKTAVRRDGATQNIEEFVRDLAEPA